MMETFIWKFRLFIEYYKQANTPEEDDNCAISGAIVANVHSSLFDVLSNEN